MNFERHDDHEQDVMIPVNRTVEYHQIAAQREQARNAYNLAIEKGNTQLIALVEEYLNQWEQAHRDFLISCYARPTDRRTEI